MKSTIPSPGKGREKGVKGRAKGKEGKKGKVKGKKDKRREGLIFFPRETGREMERRKEKGRGRKEKKRVKGGKA